MRTLAVYVLTAIALTAAVVFGFPHLFSEGAVAEQGGRSERAAPVIVATVRRGPFQDSIEALGTVRADESVEITANVADHVTKLHFDDGQRVDAGQLLLEMSSAEERAELLEANAILEERKLNFERDKELFGQDLSSGRDFQTSRAQLSTAEARVQRLEAAIADRMIRAPFAGVLGLRRVSAGAFVQPGTVVTTLDDVDTVKVDFTIPEVWLSQIAEGMPIVARSDTWKGERFSGRVETISSRIDPVSRSATLRAIVPNPEHKLRPGMLLKLAVQRDERSVLQVPEEALIPVGTDNFVLRVSENAVAERVQVRVGRRRVGTVEIEEGLEEGQRVVIEGLLRARDGGPVEVVKVQAP